MIDRKWSLEIKKKKHISSLWTRGVEEMKGQLIKEEKRGRGRVGIQHLHL